MSEESFQLARARHPRRILVAGSSGAGKTTWARRIGAALSLPHTEIDALRHGPHWVERPEFMADVKGLAASDRWVTEWQHSRAQPILASRAHVVLWLDLPTRVVMRQVVVRTLRRRLGRERLWSENREPGLWTIFTNRDHVIRGAWVNRHKVSRRMEKLRADHPELPVVRVRSHHEAAEWLARMSGCGGG